MCISVPPVTSKWGLRAALTLPCQRTGLLQLAAGASMFQPLIDTLVFIHLMHGGSQLASLSQAQ